MRDMEFVNFIYQQIIKMEEVNKLLFSFCLVSLLILLIPNGAIGQTNAMEAAFHSPPDTVQTSIYWYWISDNISKEGVVKDLKAMKSVGINRAFIGNIGLEDIPYGKVEIFSEEWWEILHTALKTATELGIDIGIFNSPGWSQSGGPWIEPEDAMRYLASSETVVRGPGKVSIILEKPHSEFQDVKVIAFPYSEDKNRFLHPGNTKISSGSKLNSLNLLFDQDLSTALSLPPGEQFVIDFEPIQSFVPRHIEIQTAEQPFYAKARWEADRGGGNFEVVREFTIDRTNPSLHVGFVPYAPVVISLPEKGEIRYRLVFEDVRSGSSLAEVRIGNEVKVERYSEKTLAKMHQTPLPYWDAYLWPSAQKRKGEILGVKKAEDVLDISANMEVNTGRLIWEVPDGTWTIMRMGMTPTRVTNAPAAPLATGLEVDKMNQKAARIHFDAFIGEILRKIPEADRKAFKVVVQDSYETGGQNFTDGFLSAFEEEYGYDPVPFLPTYEGVVVEGEEASDRFLWDVRRLIATKVAYDYVGGLRKISHEHGLTTWLENYGHWGFPGEFLMYGGQSDEIGGEFWSEGELGNIENRAASSAGHIYGKRKISAESFTAAGRPFQRHPGDFKQRGDRFFAEGVNNSLLHVFISQPYEDKNPGMNAWFGIEFNRKNTWFFYMKPFVTYLKRVNFMLQQGVNVADVAYFIGEDAPKMTGITDPPLPEGYQFDYINAEVIEKYMFVEDGWWTLPHGNRYKVLVLPPQQTMRPDLLEKIKSLVAGGGILLGPPPIKSPSLSGQPGADHRVQTMSYHLWGRLDSNRIIARQLGKGRVYCGLTLEDVFGRIGLLPDCELPKGRLIHYGHRSLPDREIYFLSNQTDRIQEFSAGFRISSDESDPDYAVEWWDPVRGEIRSLPEYQVDQGRIRIPLKLYPSESGFVVIKSGRSNENRVVDDSNFPEPKETKVLEGTWSVRFDKTKGGPRRVVKMKSLKDWTLFDEPGIKYYSGEAIYSKKIKFRKSDLEKKVVLDLGDLTAFAIIRINGKQVGGVWTRPYRLDISDFIKKGRNLIEIEVVNNWANRMIGDLNLPESERSTWATVNPFQPNSKLQPSGLFGPVLLFFY